MVDGQTKGFIEKVVREGCSPENIHMTLRYFEEKAEEETDGKKLLVFQSFIAGIKKVLGKV